MRISPSVATIAVLAALSGWMVRGIHFDAAASPVAAPIATVAPPPAVEFEAPLRVEMPANASRSGRGTRNLFAYAERDTAVVRPAVVPPAPPPIVAPAVVPPPVEERPRVRFQYRYIGRFGTDQRPIAAFARDGQVVTVRVGERIDERFVLRSIGVESVEVATSGHGPVQSERVPLNRGTL